MKRLHVHVSVADLAASIRFYKILFGAEPVVNETDYAKWMLEDPRVNFAISTRASALGLDHLGLQLDTDEELQAARAQLEAADATLLEQRDEPCCYARSNKYWVTDPTGIAWEVFHTLGRIPVYGEDRPALDIGSAAQAANVPAKACCAPAKSLTTPGQCCA